MAGKKRQWFFLLIEEVKLMEISTLVAIITIYLIVRNIMLEVSIIDEFDAIKSIPNGIKVE